MVWAVLLAARDRSMDFRMGHFVSTAIFGITALSSLLSGSHRAQLLLAVRMHACVFPVDFVVFAFVAHAFGALVSSVMLHCCSLCVSLRQLLRVFLVPLLLAAFRIPVVLGRHGYV
jgi:hypothetical protein